MSYNLLIEKQWDFSIKGRSLYYHQRIIQYMDSFDDIAEHMNKNVATAEFLDNLEGDENLILINKRNLCLSLIESALRYEDLFKVLTWIEKLNTPFDRRIYYRLKQRISKPDFEKNDERNLELLNKLNSFFRENRNLCQLKENLQEYYLVSLSSCFQNALPFFREGEEFKSNISLRDKALSEMIKLVNDNEFCFLYRFLIKEKVWDNLTQVPRNHVIQRLNIKDALNLTEILFNGEDDNSTPDRYTLISLLESAKNAIYSERNENNYISYFQNVMQILSMPIFENISYDVKTISIMLQMCSYNCQEEYLIDNFIKPSLRKELLKKEKIVNEKDIIQRVNKLWEEEKYKLEIANVIIRNPYRTDFKWIYDFSITALDKMLAKGIVLNPNILNINSSVKF